MSNIYQKLGSITEAVGGRIDKSKSQGISYEFYRIDDVLAVLRPHFVALGVDYDISVEDHTLTVEPGQDRQGNPRPTYITTVKVKITLTNCDEPTERVEAFAVGDGIDYSDKGPGKAVSYAAKTYFLQRFFLKGNPDNEADDFSREGAKPDSKKIPACETESEPVNKVRNEAPRISKDADHWQYRVPFGKNKGVRLMDLAERSRGWYAEKWVEQKEAEIAGGQQLSETDQEFMAALKKCADDCIPF